MERHQIESKLREFVDASLMDGQGADVTASTPLFEYGILDSFGLVGLLAFIAEEFDVPARLELLKKEDFENIDTIARFVHARLLSPPDV